MYAPKVQSLLLILHGHAFHYQPELVRLAAKESTILFCLPPHSCTKTEETITHGLVLGRDLLELQDGVLYHGCNQTGVCRLCHPPTIAINTFKRYNMEHLHGIKMHSTVVITGGPEM